MGGGGGGGDKGARNNFLFSYSIQYVPRQHHLYPFSCILQILKCEDLGLLKGL